MPVDYFADRDGKFVAYRARYFKTGAYRSSEVVKIVEVDGVEYMQLPSFAIKINPDFASVEGGKADVERAVSEHRPYFLNEEGGIVPARFNGDALEEDRKVRNAPKIGVQIKGFYEVNGLSHKDTMVFAEQILAICEAYGVRPAVRIFRDGETARVRIKDARFKTRDGAMQAMTKIRALIPKGTGGRQMMNLL